jgi:hypothetical protein
MATPSKSKSGDGAQHTNGGQRGGQMTPSHPRHLFPTLAPLGRLRTEFDRLFDDFMHGFPTAWGGERPTWLGPRYAGK